MLYNVVDDRSGLAYQEYHVVYGEEPARLYNFCSPPSASRSRRLSRISSSLSCGRFVHEFDPHQQGEFSVGQMDIMDRACKPNQVDHQERGQTHLPSSQKSRCRIETSERATLREMFIAPFRILLLHEAVCSLQNMTWNVEPDGLGSGQVDSHRQLLWHLHEHLRWLGPSQNLGHQLGGLLGRERRSSA
jgi:hypothetical protein